MKFLIRLASIFVITTTAFSALCLQMDKLTADSIYVNDTEKQVICTLTALGFTKIDSSIYEKGKESIFVVFDDKRVRNILYKNVDGGASYEILRRLSGTKPLVNCDKREVLRFYKTNSTSVIDIRKSAFSDCPLVPKSYFYKENVDE